MASGIVHDFNNVLAPIAGFADLLLADLDDAPDGRVDPATTRQYVELIRTGATDAAAVVSRLREFYRPREEADDFVPVDLNRVVERVASLTEPRWRGQVQAGGHTIALDLALGDVPPIAGSDGELREALTNLVFNAVDALPRGGHITIRTAAQGDLAVLTVSDDGIGMTEDVRRRALEPFFTTKGNRGTGLGLAMVLGTVQRHGGTIQIESEPARGTTFRITFPPANASVPLPAAVESPPPARALRLLVVEDEAAVRDVLVRLLGVDGHSAAVATGGDEAL